MVGLWLIIQFCGDYQKFLDFLIPFCLIYFDINSCGCDSVSPGEDRMYDNDDEDYVFDCLHVCILMYICCHAFICM